MITEDDIRKAKRKVQKAGGVITLSDGGGLYVSVCKKKDSFYLRWSDGGQQFYKQLGSTEHITLNGARKRRTNFFKRMDIEPPKIPAKNKKPKKEEPQLYLF